MKVLNAKLTEIKTPKPIIKVNVQKEAVKEEVKEETKVQVAEVSETSPEEEGK